MDDVCRKTQRPLRNCRHGDKHRFKVIVTKEGTDNDRKCKTLKTRDYKEAIRQTEGFYEEIKNSCVQKDGGHMSYNNLEVALPAKKVTPNRESVLISNEMGRYISYLKADPEIVHYHERDPRTPKHIDEVDRIFTRFAECMEKHKKGYFTLNVFDVGKEHAGYYCQYMDDLGLKERTYNHSLSIFSTFYKWMNEFEQIEIRNPFATAKRKPMNTVVQIIELEEYRQLLEIVKREELGIGVVGKEKKNFYRPWLQDAIELAMETGRRREEIVFMNWKDLIKKNDGKYSLKVEDIKVNRIKRLKGDNKKYNWTPMTKGLLTLLKRLGMDEHKRSDRFILAPDSDMTRESIKNFITRAFKHYYRQLNSGKNLTFTCLRDTYTTYLVKLFGPDKARLITGHSGIKVMIDSYIDMGVLADAAENFKVFDGEVEGESNILVDDVEKFPT